MESLKTFAKSNTAARIRAAAAKGALSHALVLSGRGDLPAAAKYAACAMECTSAEKPCLCCAHCRKVAENIHPDVTFVRDDEHSEIAVDIVREVRADAFIRPNEGARKVYIFDDCTRLSDKDQNVLLKVVEEGPPYAAFLFCAENAATLLVTLRSRCTELRLDETSEEQSDERAAELCALLGADAAARCAFFTELEVKKTSREELAALFSAARILLADALAARLGLPRAAAEGTQRLTKAQILGTIDILDEYRKHCDYNVGVGPLLGGLAAELEEIL